MKQVIVMRKFQSLRIGKYIAQGAHASQIALKEAQMFFPEYYAQYMSGSITKIVVYVDTLIELMTIYNQVEADGRIPVSLITDAGHTEFKGQPTVTAVGIGPAPDELIDPITKHLPLF